MTKTKLIGYLLASTLLAGAANAERRGSARQGQGFVTAESRFGHGTVSGPVRVASKGNYEVELAYGKASLQVIREGFFRRSSTVPGTRCQPQC